MDEVCYTKFIVKFMTFYYYLSLTTNNGDVNSSAIHYELAFLLDSVFRHWLLSIYFTGPRTRVLRGNKTSGQGASCWIPRQGARWHSVTAFSIIWFLLTNEQCVEREREMSERDSDVSGRDFLIRSWVFVRKTSCYIFVLFCIFWRLYTRDLTASRYSGDD